MKKSPSELLVRAVTEVDFESLQKESLDSLVDEILGSEALRMIPGVSQVLAIYRDFDSIRSRFFVKKVCLFLRALNTGRSMEDDQLSIALHDPKARVRFGETLLHILERLEDARKAELLGHIWNACGAGYLPFDKAMRISAMIDRAYWYDICFLATIQPGVQGDDEPIADSLHGVGFLENVGIDAGSMDEDGDSGGTLYDLNEYGSLLVENGLKKMDLQ